MERTLINRVPIRYFFKYPFSKTSPFRINQGEFIRTVSPMVKGKVIEIGAEDQYYHQNFFNEDISYLPTNISKTGENYLDVTDIKFPDNSVDNYLCISVLEHVKDITKGICEIQRTLRPGGKLLLVIPFGHPIHDKVDFWRLAPDGYYELFKEFSFIKFYHLGGILSTCAMALQRPKRLLDFRFICYKLIGWQSLFLSKYFERIDDFPSGFGLVLEKK